MRLLCLIAGTLGVLLAGAGPAAAAGPTHHQFSFRGSFAAAEFPGLAPGTIPEPGVIYTNTFVVAGEEVTRNDGTHYADGSVHLDQFSFRYTEQGEFQPLATTAGTAHGTGVALKVSGDVSEASASAHVPVTRCEFDPVVGWSCADAGTRAVTVAWSGTGDASRGMSVSTWSSGESRYVSRTSGTYRNASATATIDAAGLGTSNWGSISRARSGSIQICRDC